MWIFAVLIAVPIIEIALFIELGGWVGLWPTIGLVVLTAIIGGVLLRMQGFAAMARLQRSMAEGADPSGPLAHGAMILVAGLLMLTPGFFTDAVGFALLLPPVRSALIGWAGPRLAGRVLRAGPGGPQGGRPGAKPPGWSPMEGPIDDVEYTDITENPPPKDGGAWSRRPPDAD